MAVTLKTIEEAIAPLGGRDSYSKEFIFELLSAYGRSAGNITRLRNGSLNVAENPSQDVAQKNIVLFRPVTDGSNLYATIDDLKSDQTVVRYSIRFVIVTDYQQLLAMDTKTNETLDIPIHEINKYFTFFLPWAGMEKAQYVAENHADIKAAYKMSKLFDEIVSFSHHPGNAEYYHGLNVFFCRLLFCFFAEDTEIFNKGQFTGGIESHTQTDGSDLNTYLDELFFALDAEDKEGYPAHIAAFPYVNGGLFHQTHKVPKFNAKARQLLLECGNLNWSSINPDIFGSMIQAVVNPGQRAGLGMHYTSVPNIMKTIEPLFLNDLKEEFNKYFNDKAKLEKLLSRVGNIKIFDPACGSGNFLIIAYKELRKLEHALLERIDDLTPHAINRVMFSRINVENFYGIEIDDFAHEVAILSLWLAKHQMNLEFKQKFGVEIPLIPLREAGNIVRGNATRLDWNKICPNNPRLSSHARMQQSKLIADDYEQSQLISEENKEWDEIYLISNPPYQGSSLQDVSQKKDMQIVFSDLHGYKNLDYIACWFKKGAEYINGTKAELAFVSTNSVCQGEQVGLLWPFLLKRVEIGFAYTSFKWSNNARGSAGVTCIILNLRSRSDKKKVIYTDTIRQSVTNISPYLTDGDDLIIYKRSRPISELPTMSYGSKAVDNGSLLLTTTEKEKLLGSNEYATKFVKRYVGADELLNDKVRWCLWINDETAEKALSIEPIKERVRAVRAYRLKSKKAATRLSAERAYEFGEPRYKSSKSIVVPRVFSERREYITAGYYDENTVVADSAQLITEAETYVFSIISSRFHMLWTKAVCGQLESRIRYSSVLSYNNFPIPSLALSQKELLSSKAFNILDAREHHSEQTLAELYDPDKMPEDLRNAHKELDKVVDSVYRSKPFENDEERLAHLFKLYEDMAAKEKETIPV